MTAVTPSELRTIPVAEARTLLEEVLQTLSYAADDASTIADHLLDCELRGLGYGGLARLISIAERLRASPSPLPPRVVRESPSSAAIDGGDTVGYLVAQQAVDIAAAKAGATGLALVGANHTWYTGMLSYYAEQATQRGLVVLLASNATSWVAPHGASSPRYGTNPICFGFPAAGGDDAIWDIGTSMTTHAEVVLARRQNQALPEGVALDAHGRPTTDPDEALAGAFTPWGGARGAGLGLVVQMLGMLAGSPSTPDELTDFGFFVATWSPGLLGDPDDFAARVAAYADWVRTAQPDPSTDGAPVRMPFDRSRRRRAETLARGTIDVDAQVVDTLRAFTAGGAQFS